MGLFYVRRSKLFSSQYAATSRSSRQAGAESPTGEFSEGLQQQQRQPNSIRHYLSYH